MRVPSQYFFWNALFPERWYWLSYLKTFLAAAKTWSSLFLWEQYEDYLCQDVQSLHPRKAQEFLYSQCKSGQIVVGMSLTCLNCHKHYMPHCVGWEITLCQDFYLLAHNKLPPGKGASSPTQINKPGTVSTWGTIFLCTGKVHFLASHSPSLPRIPKTGWQIRAEDPSANPVNFFQCC